MSDLAAFARLIDALRPWLPDLVFVGGWSHRLQRFHALANPPAHLPLATRDADVAFSDTSRLEGSIQKRFVRPVSEELSGEHVPPAVQYRLRGTDGFYAEFLTPLHGSGQRRDGTLDATMERAGITAQRLRHLDLLLLHPWSVTIGPADGVPLQTDAKVLIANPVAFIAQKLLISAQRMMRKKAQDALYIHDTLELFGRELGTLHGVWCDDVRPSVAAKTVRSIEQAARTQFAGVSPVIQGAARIPRDRTLRPDRVQQLCDYGLGRIFHSPDEA
jgi:hypothetical protein